MRILPTLLTLVLSSIAFTEISVAEDTAVHGFFEKLAQGGLTEVQAGQLAQSQATSEPVRKFGVMMVEDHGAANKKLAALAKKKGVTLPTAPSESQKESLKALQARSGARFDPEYMAMMVKAHEATVKLLNSEIASGTDPDAKAFAREILPTVESHLKEATRLAGTDGRA
jgi:putative membrane protein